MTPEEEGRLQELEGLVKRYRSRIVQLKALLEDCVEVLDNYADVDDGDDGQPVANRAMGLQATITTELAR